MVSSDEDEESDANMAARAPLSAPRALASQSSREDSGRPERKIGRRLNAAIMPVMAAVAAENPGPAQRAFSVGASGGCSHIHDREQRGSDGALWHAPWCFSWHNGQRLAQPGMPQ